MNSICCLLTNSYMDSVKVYAERFAERFAKRHAKQLSLLFTLAQRRVHIIPVAFVGVGL